MSPPFSIQQLSLYTRALTSVRPFVLAQKTVKGLFDAIVKNAVPPGTVSDPVETLFLKILALLYTKGSMQTYKICVARLLTDVTLHQIVHTKPDFQEEWGACAAVSCIATLFQFGDAGPDGCSKSVLRLAYDAERARRSTSGSKDHPSKLGGLHATDIDASKASIQRAAYLVFEVLRALLQRQKEPEAFSIIHVFLAFVWSLSDTSGAMEHVEDFIPWTPLVAFLNSIDPATAEVVAMGFPKPQADEPNRPLPEDFIMHGQVYSKFYFPPTWFTDVALDQEERHQERTSMAEHREIRLYWLGRQLAKDGRHISYDATSNRFREIVHAPGLQAKNA